MTDNTSGNASGERFETEHWPLEIRLKTAEKRVEIDFDNGATFSYPAELLRVESPSAEVKGHSPAQRKTVPGKRKVGIVGIDPIGHYAVRIRFDDGHATGIYSWKYLYDLGERQDEIWRDYIKALDDKGMSRDRPGVPR